MTQEQVPTCTWTEDENGPFSTYCNHSFYFEDGSGPKSNDFKFCPFCGKTLQSFIRADCPCTCHTTEENVDHDDLDCPKCNGDGRIDQEERMKKPSPTEKACVPMPALSLVGR